MDFSYVATTERTKSYEQNWMLAVIIIGVNIDRIN